MSEITFNIDDWSQYPNPYPKCVFMLINRGIYEPDLKVPIGDERIEDSRNMFTTKIQSDNHQFSDVGYPRCSICGWSPLDEIIAGGSP